MTSEFFFLVNFIYMWLQSWGIFPSPYLYVAGFYGYYLGGEICHGDKYLHQKCFVGDIIGLCFLRICGHDSYFCCRGGLTMRGYNCCSHTLPEEAGLLGYWNFPWTLSLRKQYKLCYSQPYCPRLYFVLITQDASIGIKWWGCGHQALTLAVYLELVLYHIQGFSNKRGHQGHSIGDGTREQVHSVTEPMIIILY